MLEIHTIGILTGGGDCPGLNAVIRGAVRTALGKGMTGRAKLPASSALIRTAGDVLLTFHAVLGSVLANQGSHAFHVGPVIPHVAMDAEHPAAEVYVLRRDPRHDG